MEIKQLKVTHQDEMAAIKTELLEIKSSLKISFAGNDVNKPVRDNLQFGNGNSRGRIYDYRRPRNFNRKMRRCGLCVDVKSVELLKE